MFVVVSKIKSLMKNKEMRVSKELCAKLSDAVEDMLTQAAARAKADKRKTVKVEDL